MKWLLHLYKCWPLYLAALATLSSAGWYIHHSIYESGYAAAEAKWQPKFDAAQRELKAANAKADQKETDSKAVTAASQRRIDETLQTLHARSADYDSRLRALSVRLAAASARRCEVPEVGGGTPATDGTTESDQRAAEAGGELGKIGADCESDAARLAEWQRFFTEQRAIINR